MYYQELHIVVVGGEPALAEAAGSAIPLERFTHRVSVCGEGAEQAIRDGDVILLELKSAASLGKVRALAPKAVVVACGSPAEIAALDDGAFQAADGFWEKPLDPRLTAFRLQKLLEAIKLRKDLRLTQTYLDSAIDSIPDMVWFKDKDGLHLKVNKSFCSIVGKSREDVTGKDHCYIWNVTQEEFAQGVFVCQETEDTVMQLGRTCQFEEKVKTQHGLRQFTTYKSPLFDEDGGIMGTVGIGHDVTDLENMGAEIELLLRSMPFAIVLRNSEGIVINVNRQVEAYFSMDKTDVIGKEYSDWMRDAFREERTVNNEGYVEARVGNAENRILEIHEEQIYDVFENVVGHLSIYRDVTVERALEQQILHNSNTDFLTGLYNRRCFYQYIQKNRGNKQISLLYVDLDQFKKVNDTYGHGVGDEVLIRTASLLRQCFPNEFIARLGGDEFIVAFLGDYPVESLTHKAQDFISSTNGELLASLQIDFVSASIGIAQSEDPGIDIDTLIQQSDKALYEAKLAGKGRYCVYQG